MIATLSPLAQIIYRMVHNVNWAGNREQRKGVFMSLNVKTLGCLAAAMMLTTSLHASDCLAESGKMAGGVLEKDDTVVVEQPRQKYFRMKRGNEYELSLNVGQKFEKFDWSIAAGNVDVASELTWKKLHIFQAGVGGSMLLKENLPLPIYLRGSFAYGWIMSGDNQDSDYSGAGRTSEYSRSNNKSDYGNEHSASLGIGTQFSAFGGILKISPLAGYSYLNQKLYMRDGYQTIPNTGSFAGLNSTYKHFWHGPWGGVDLKYSPHERVAIRGTFEYHFATSYSAEGDWNLRTTLAHPKSLEHSANARGIVSGIGADFAISRYLGLSADVGYQSWKTDSGVDRRYYSNGTDYVGKFNGANMEAVTTSVKLNYRF